MLRTIDFAHFGNINEFLCDILNIIKEDAYDAKTKKGLQRFCKQDELSIDEYEELSEMLIDDLAYYFTKDNKKEFELLKMFLKNSIDYYYQYTSMNETMGTTQKQLDFLVAMDVVIPMCSGFFAWILQQSGRPEPLIADRILPSLGEHPQNAIQKTFELLALDLDLEKCPMQNHSTLECVDYKKLFKPILQKILEEESPKNLESHDKIINHWLNGEHIPNSTHLQYIKKLGTYCKTFKENSIEALLKIAKIIHRIQETYVPYFGVELSELLIKHYRLANFIQEFIEYQYHQTQDENIIESFLQGCRQNLSQNQELCHALINYIRYYADIAYIPFEVFFNHHENEFDYRSRIRGIKDTIRYREKYWLSLVFIKEASFFECIDDISPIRIFSPKDSETLNFNTYFEAYLTAFFNPDISRITAPAIKDEETFINKEFRRFSEMACELYVLSEPTRKKEAGDDVKFEEALQKLQQIYDTDSNPYIHFPQARFYAHKAIQSTSTPCKESLKQALEYYLKALHKGKRVMGTHFEALIKEGLAVSAQLTREEELDLNNAKAPFSKFYKEAYYLKLIKEKPKDLKQYFTRDYKKMFKIIFKYPFDMQQNNHEVDSILLTPNLVFSDIEKYKNIKIDFKNPNKWIKNIYPNPTTQLMHCCLWQDLQSVQKLIQHGVDVNVIRPNDNGNALHCALDNQKTIASTEIAKLLIPLMSKDTINSKLKKKKKTALSIAIEHGYVELIEPLIKQGASLSMKATLDHCSPLYWCLIYIAHAKGPDPKFTPTPFTDAEYRSIAISNFGAFESDMHKLDFFTQENESLIERLYDNLRETYQKNLLNYYKIFDILIKYADSDIINLPEKNDFTPLLFATELNEIEIVKKLLAKGANKYHKNSFGLTAYDYATVHHNIALMNLLR